jgi:hypothetical protein
MVVSNIALSPTAVLEALPKARAFVRALAPSAVLPFRKQLGGGQSSFWAWTIGASAKQPSVNAMNTREVFIIVFLSLF